MPKVMLVVYGD